MSNLRLCTKFLPALIGVIACAASPGAATGATELTIRTSIRYDLEKDPRTWLPEYPVTNGPVVFIEWVLKGDSIKSWKELLDERTLLTKGSIREHLDVWRSLLARVDSKAEVQEEKNADGSITVTYTSIAADEMGISRYFEGNDGIYILSYRVRPKLQNAEMLKLWRQIISKATLAPEHVSKSEAPSRSEEALYGQLINNGTASVSIAALELVLKTPEEFSAGILYIACGVAFREKRLEDAGFLLYVARFRSRFDIALFPPTGTGGDSPLLALAALHQELGSVVNPGITREPKVYAKVLARVKSWNPKVPPTYEPGWEYSKKGSQRQAEEAVADNRKEVIDHMNGFSTLLLDGAYFSALKVAQDYNLKMHGDPNRPSKEAYDAAIQTMERIEKDKGIEAVTAAIQQ